MLRGIGGLIVVVAVDVLGDVTHIGSFREETDAIIATDQYQREHEDAQIRTEHCSFKTAW